MATVLDTAELIDSEDQTAFNFAVWEKVVVDPLLAGLPHRVETNRHGQIVMSPPPAPEHGEEQSQLVCLLRQLLPGGRIITECPVSTSEGVKLVDVAWMSKQRRQAQEGQICFIQAPEICVEVVSPGNTRRELREKKALYFEAAPRRSGFVIATGGWSSSEKKPPRRLAAQSCVPVFRSASRSNKPRGNQELVE